MPPVGPNTVVVKLQGGVPRPPHPGAMHAAPYSGAPPQQMAAASPWQQPPPPQQPQLVPPPQAGAARPGQLQQQQAAPAAGQRPGAEHLASSSAPSTSAPAIKPDWTEHTAPDGRKYYYNSKTKQSSWQKPAALMSQQVCAPPAIHCTKRPLALLWLLFVPNLETWVGQQDTVRAV